MYWRLTVAGFALAFALPFGFLERKCLTWEVLMQSPKAHLCHIKYVTWHILVIKIDTPLLPQPDRVMKLYREIEARDTPRPPSLPYEFARVWPIQSRLSSVGIRFVDQLADTKKSPHRIVGRYRRQITAWYIKCFYARQHICYSAYMLWQFRLSVCLSHGWISQKRLKLGSRNFHHTVAPSL